jgi:methionyl-tRNA formyltransferase
VASLRAAAPEVLLVASYGEILRQEVLDLAPLGALNVHGSLLPRWRGAAPIQAAILAGDTVTGVSIQRMVKKLDAGDVLLERRTPIGADETSGDLFTRLSELGAEAALEALELVESGRARFIPQDETRVTHVGKLDKAQGRIDWSRSAIEIERMVRGLNPWPLARCADGKGGELSILRARVRDNPIDAVGAVRFVEGCVLVGCGAGALELIEIKPAGKGAMKAADWWRGARLPEGTALALP